MLLIYFELPFTSDKTDEEQYILSLKVLCEHLRKLLSYKAHINYDLQ